MKMIGIDARKTYVSMTALFVVLLMTVSAFAPAIAVETVTESTPAAQPTVPSPPEAAQAAEQPAIAAAPEPIESESVTIQPDSFIGKDTWITNVTTWNGPDGNEGADTMMWSANVDMDVVHSMVEFDIPVKPNANVKSATLSLFTPTGQVSGSPQNVSVHALTADWDEGAMMGGIPDTANWSYRTDQITVTSNDFEAGNGGLVGTNDWEYGEYIWTGWNQDATAKVPPPGAHSGTHMWGTVLNSTYTNIARTSSLNCTVNLAGRTTPWLEFWDWYDVFENFDHCEVYVNGILELDRGAAYVAPTAWTRQSIDLTAYTGATVTVEFRMWTTAVVAYAGWYIDDLALFDSIAPLTWATPGGDYLETPNSYQFIAEDNSWYQWNVTQMVRNFNSGTWVNHGFLIKHQNVLAGTHFVGFNTSDSYDERYWPKLTIYYGAEMTRLVPAQTFNEDDPARTISLSGSGAGTVEHLAGPCELSTAYPFGGAITQLHYQSVFNSSQVGAEGVVKRISINRTTMVTGNYSNFTIYLAHTDLDDLTDTFANNYNGYLTEVFSETNFVANSSNGDSWIHFDLNDNFTYDGAHNLLVDIQFTGKGGTPTMSHVTSDVGTKRIWDTTGAATGTINSNRPAFIFLVDAADNGIVDNGTMGGIFWVFGTGSAASMKMQRLYNSTIINQSGIIDSLNFQAFDTFADWSVVENFTIKLAYCTDGVINATFATNNDSPWVTVLTSPSYNVTAPANHGWITLDVDNVFDYNGVDDLLIEITWQGGYYSENHPMAGIYLSYRPVVGYDCSVAVDDITATTATSVSQNLANLKVVFADSADLTWSASSSDPSIFTVGVMNNNLVITPQADENGAGTIILRLTNSNDEQVSQLISVTINAVNDAPMLAALTAITCVEDEPYALNISSQISDIDDVIGNITVSTDSDYATVNGTVITFLYPEGVTGEIVAVTVEDAGGASASQDLAVTVEMVNDEPWFDGFAGTVVCDATVPESVPLTPDDEESNSGQLDIFCSSPYAIVTGHTLQLLYPKGIGFNQVTIYLVDNTTYGSQNNVSYVLNVTIIDHPEVIDNSPEGTAVPVTTNVQATFDSPMNRTKTENAFSMALGTTAIAGTFAWTSDSTGMTFTPTEHLTNGLYVVRIAASAENETGVKMLSAFEWNFTAALGTFDGDGDGMTDQWEMDNGLDPNVDDALEDLDNDGMPNIYEFENDLDPAVDDSELDSDDDGYTNLEEYEEGTDPNDPESAPSDFTWIILVLVIVAIVAVLLIVLLMRRKKEPAHGPEPWQEQPGEPGQPSQYEQGQYPPPPPEGQPPQDNQP